MQELTDDKSALVQVMAWCHQVINWANDNSDLFVSSLGHNELKDKCTHLEPRLYCLGHHDLGLDSWVSLGSLGVTVSLDCTLRSLWPRLYSGVTVTPRSYSWALMPRIVLRVTHIVLWGHHEPHNWNLGSPRPQINFLVTVIPDWTLRSTCPQIELLVMGYSAPDWIHGCHDLRLYSLDHWDPMKS